MDRRNFLTLSGVTGISSIAGCFGSSPESDTTTTTQSKTTTTETTETTTETTQSSVNYPSHTGTHEITHEDMWWAWEFSVEKEFDIEITAVNRRSSDYDFDLYLFTSNNFEEYKSVAQSGDGNINPISGASEEGVVDKATPSADLDAGSYALVVDNTDIGDAGDVGEQATRRVHVEAKTSEDSGV